MSAAAGSSVTQSEPSSLARVWQALHDSLGVIQQRATSPAEPPGSPGRPDQPDQPGTEAA
jgi:hypothetical protein